jgi:hypothetical protein
LPFRAIGIEPWGLGWMTLLAIFKEFVLFFMLVTSHGRFGFTHNTNCEEVRFSMKKHQTY